MFAEQLRLAYVALTPRVTGSGCTGAGEPAQGEEDGSLPDEGLHSSALAWLLHGRELPGEQPLTELGNHLAGLNGGSLRLAIERLVATSDGRMACLPLESREASTQGSSRAAPEQLAQLNRSLYSAWRIGSFSGLAAGMHGSAGPRRPGDARCRRAGQRLFAFPRGARAGTCLHAILEDWARGKGELALVEPALKAYGLPWRGLATAQLERVLQTDLDGAGLTLASLQAARRLPELGFTFPVRELDVARLRAC